MCQLANEISAGETAPQQTAKASRANRDVIVIEPEADLVARLDAQLVTQLLRDGDLTFRSDSVSHTAQYNSATARRELRRQFDSPHPLCTTLEGGVAHAGLLNM